MKLLEQIETKTDTAKLDFRPSAVKQKYGDGRSFHEWRIEMLRGQRVVGIEVGPRRIHRTLTAAMAAAQDRISELRSHRLFVIRITRKDISAGDARNCNSCAIALALWNNQERMGFGKNSFNFEVSPYGTFLKPRGIVLSRRYSSMAELTLNDLPDLVTCIIEGRTYSDSMVEWAMNWDDWAESRFMSLKEWRDRHGYDDERPSKPGPASFVLDLDEFEQETVNAA